jgi:hypothetical protein
MANPTPPKPPVAPASAAANRVELHAIVVALSRSFAVNKDGRLAMSEEDAQKHLKAVQSVPKDERETVATHLVALAFRFKEQAGEAADGAITLLIAYAVAIFDGDVQKVGDMFGAAGMQKQAAAVIGATQPIAAPARADDKPKPAAVKATRGLKKPP